LSPFCFYGQKLPDFLRYHWYDKDMIRLIDRRAPLKVATVFSGIGALEQALIKKNIPHKIIFACDNDPFVKQSYFANYNIEESRWFDDIKFLPGLRFKGKVDLLMGGSPCQSFSIVGSMKGLEDDRGNLIFEFVKLVKKVQPKIFIFENVKGLLSNNKGETWRLLEAAFKKTGYQIQYKVLNAKDYGIPQHRERLFLVGFKTKQKFEFPKPFGLGLTMQDLLQDSVQSKYHLPEKGIVYVNRHAKKKFTQIDGAISICQKSNQQFNWRGDFVSVDEKYFLSERTMKVVLSTGTKNFHGKPKTDLEVARPLTATMHKMHRAHQDNYVTRGQYLRKLTPRECLRLMGFSDTFKIVVSDMQMYRQSGNSIVVDVVERLLEQF